MTSAALPVGLLIGGGSAPRSGTTGELSTLDVIYQNLISGGAQTFTSTGSQILVMDSGAIGTASTVQVGSYPLYGNEATETLAQVSENFETLKRIAAYCCNNGISVQVDASLNNGTTFSDGTNALVDQWASVAAAAGLPIAFVQDVNEQGIVSDTTAAMFANQASIEVCAVQTLIKAYVSSSYHLTASNLAVGDMEAGTMDSLPNISQWWSAYDTAAQIAGIEPFSFVSAEMGWDAPWLPVESGSDWQNYVSALYALSKLDNMALDVVVQGMQTDITGSMFVLQQEQHAAQLASFTESSGIDVNNILLRTWQPFPVGVNLITAPNSMSNSALEITATYPLYQVGSITVQNCVTVDVPGQAIVTTGLNTSLTGLSVNWTQTDVSADHKLAVVIIDQTGTLNATPYMQGTVSHLAANTLILNGNSAEISAEISSITLNEPNSGPDTIDVETFGASGQLSDNQINVLALANEQQSDLIESTSNQQGWVSSSVFLNTGTVVGIGSIVTSETLYWNTVDTLTGSLQGTPAFVKIDSVHEPLAEYGVKKLSVVENGTTLDSLADYFDASVDNPYLAPGGYANNAGNFLQSANNITWQENTLKVDPFNPVGEVTSFAVMSTINKFDSNNGMLQESMDILAPSPLSTVNFYGTAVANLFSNAFDLGGTQVTEFNTGSNLAWQPAWGIGFKSATLTYDHAGQLVETFLKGGTSQPSYSIDTVYNPANGQIWEQFQTVPPPEGYGGFATGPLYITQFNTGDNPNWDYLDWGNAVVADTEVVSTYLITDNFIGVAFGGVDQAVKFSSGTIYGADNASAILSGSDDIIQVGVNDTLHVNGDRNSITGTTNETVTQNGAGYVDTLGTGSAINNTATNASFTVNGSGIKVTAASGDSVQDSGTTNIFTFLNGGTLTERGAGASAVVIGDGVTTWLNLAGQTIQATGNSGVITTSTSADVTVLGDHNTIGAGSGSKLSLSGNSEVVYGADLLVNLSTNTTATVNGDRNSITGTTNETVTQNGAGYVDTLGTGSAINNTATNASFTVNGSGIKVTAASGDSVQDSGTTNIFTFLNGGTLTERGAGASAVVIGDGVTTWLNLAGQTIQATGNSGVITTSTSADVTVLGDHNTIGAGSGSKLSLSGNSEVVYGADLLVNLSTNTTATVNGDRNSITGTTNETVTQNGAGYVDTLGTGSAINNTATNASFTVNGSGIKVTAASGDSVQDSGTTNIFTFLNGGTLTERGAGASAVVIGDGVTTWLNLAGQTIQATGNSGVITTSTSADVTVLGDHNTIGAGSGSKLSLSGNSEVVYGADLLVNLNTNTTATVNGDRNSITGTTNETVTQNGAGYVDTLGTGSAINNTATNASFTVNGSGIKVTAASGDSVFLTGDRNSITGTTNETVTQNGAGYVDTLGTGSAINNTATNASFTVNGSGIKVTAASGDSVFLTGDRNSITGTTNETVTQNGAGYVDTLGTGSAINNTATNASFTVNGSGIKVTAASGDSVFLTGDRNSITGTTNETVTQNGAGYVDTLGTGSAINNTATNASFTVNGSGIKVTAASGDSVFLTGDRNSITGTTNETVTQNGAGYVDTLGTGSAINNTATNASFTVNGSGIKVTAASGDSVFLTGDRNSITGTTNETVTQNGAGYVDTLGTGSAINNTATNASFTVNGSGIKVTAASGDSVFLTGDRNSITGTTNETVTQNGAGYVDTLGTGSAINNTATNASFTVNGSGIKVTAASGDSVFLTGDRNSITGTTNETVTQNGAGYVDTLGTGSAINNTATNASFTVNGSGIKVTAASGDSVFLTGDRNSITGTTNETVTQNGAGYVDTLGTGSAINNTATNASFTVNGSGIKVTAASGDSVFLTGDRNSITGTTNETVTQNGAGYVDTLGTGSAINNTATNASFTVNGSGIKVTAASGDSVFLTGDRNSITGTTNETVTQNGAGYVDTLGTGSAINNTATNASFTVNGSGIKVTAASGDSVFLTGDRNSITGTTNETVTQNGAGYVDTLGTGSAINNTATNASFTVNGSGIKVTAASGDSVFLTGDRNSITGTTNETVTQNGAGYVDTLGTGSAINNTATNASFTVNGSGIKVTAASGDSVFLTGDRNSITGTTNETVTQNGAGYVDTLGTGSAINNTATNASFTVNGSGIKVTAASGDSVFLTGDRNSITGTTNETVTQNGAGYVDTLGTGSAINNTATNASFTVNGSGIKVTAASGDSVFLTGDRNSITGTTNETVTQNGAGYVDTLGTGSAINNTATNASFTVNGSGIKVTAASGDSVQDSGTTNIFTFLNGGTLTERGAGASAVVIGDGVTTWLNLAGQTIQATGNSGVITTSTSADVTVLGDHNTIGAGSGSKLSLSGNSEVVYGADLLVNLNTNTTATVNGTGDSIMICGTNIAVTASHEVILSENGSSFSLIGSGSTIDLIANSKALIDGVTKISFISESTGHNSLIANQGSQVIAGFNMATGDRLDLTQILAGTSALETNLGNFIKTTWSGSDTTLTVTGPGVSDSITLSHVGSISLQNLINNKVFVLPTHDISLHEISVPWTPDTSRERKHANRSKTPADTKRKRATQTKPPVNTKGQVRSKDFEQQQSDLVAHFSRIQVHLLENPKSLTDHEMLEMFLQVALSKQDTRSITRVLLTKYSTLGAVIGAPANELAAIDGIGRTGATRLKLLHAIMVSVLRKEIEVSIVLECWDQLIDYLSVSLKHERVECFHLLFLDNRGALIADEIQANGTINQVSVYPREIVRRCLELHASALIMVHNHPSGDPQPSPEDITITLAVQRAAAIMGIALHDHIIVGRMGYRSFRKEKLM